MRQVLIGLIALMLVGTACTQKEASPAQKPDQPTTSPSGMQTPAAAPGGTNTPATPTNPDATKPNTPAPAPDAKPEPAAPERPQGAKEPPTATQQQFDSVNFGMTYDEVSKSMGQIGKLISETNDDSGMNAIQTYQYQNKDGGMLKITFRNGKVLNKSSSTAK